jgi:hypothetical protein
MKVQAWQCKHCESLFVTRQAMTGCETKCTKRIKDEQAAVKFAAERLAASDEIRLAAEEIYEIPGLITIFVKKYLDRIVNITKWDLKFNPKMATTHDAPIGQHNSGWGKEMIYHMGWDGTAEGTTNLKKKPVTDERATFGEIDDFSDLFGGYGRGVIRGINTGGGTGGEKFHYTMRLYLNDFPKIKDRYDIYAPLRQKQTRATAKVKELRDAALIEVINSDKRIMLLDDVNKLLELKLKQTKEAREQARLQVMTEEKYKTAIKLPPEYDFDYELLQKVSGDF